MSAVREQLTEPRLDAPSDGALDLYRQAVRLNPEDADAHGNLGTALYLRGDVDGAIAEFRRSLTLRPNDTTLHNDLGVALYKKGERAAALEEFRVASMLDPNGQTYARENATGIEAVEGPTNAEHLREGPSEPSAASPPPHDH